MHVVRFNVTVECGVVERRCANTRHHAAAEARYSGGASATPPQKLQKANSTYLNVLELNICFCKYTKPPKEKD